MAMVSDLEDASESEGLNLRERVMRKQSKVSVSLQKNRDTHDKKNKQKKNQTQGERLEATPEANCSRQAKTIDPEGKAQTETICKKRKTRKTSKRNRKKGAKAENVETEIRWYSEFLQQELSYYDEILKLQVSDNCVCVHADVSNHSEPSSSESDTA